MKSDVDSVVLLVLCLYIPLPSSFLLSVFLFIYFIYLFFNPYRTNVENRVSS